jgi:hypothetical protein
MLGICTYIDLHENGMNELIFYVTDDNIVML